MKKTLAAAMCGLMLLATPAVAEGNNNCGTVDQAQALVDQHKEIPVLTYVDPQDVVILIYANFDTGTVTVFASAIGKDYYCVISEGTGVMVGDGGSKKKKPDAPTWKQDKGDS